VFLIGSWYTKDELGKRSNIFQAATAGGTLLSGVLQGGVQTTLNGKGGMPGWRWIFTIDAVISIPIAICAFFFIPDLPSVIKPNWIFKQDDIDLANARLAQVGRSGPKKGNLNLKALWKILTTWEIFAFTFVYVCYIFAQSRSSIGTGESELTSRSSTIYVVLVEDVREPQIHHSTDQLLPLWYMGDSNRIGARIRLDQ
jgi:ACS family pantothenate transporter-like MFS transporter